MVNEIELEILQLARIAVRRPYLKQVTDILINELVSLMDAPNHQNPEHFYKILESKVYDMLLKEF
jgi:hypothetical protein